MAGSRSMRLVRAALRCYPERWRRRHGEEAAELARLLLRDGKPAAAIAWSYLRGAAGARLMQPRRRLGAALGALLAAGSSLGVSLALLSPSAPASAASVVRVRITGHRDAAGQLEALLRAHHVRFTVTQEPVSPSLAGSIIGPGAGALRGITGPCAGPGPIPGHDYVAGGIALSPSAISLRVTAGRPADRGATGSDGQRC